MKNALKKLASELRVKAEAFILGLQVPTTYAESIDWAYAAKTTTGIFARLQATRKKHGVGAFNGELAERLGENNSYSGATATAIKEAHARPREVADDFEEIKARENKFVAEHAPMVELFVARESTVADRLETLRIERAMQPRQDDRHAAHDLVELLKEREARP